MLVPDFATGKVELGPFFSAGALAAVLSELALTISQIGLYYSASIKSTTYKAFEARAGYWHANADWLKYFKGIEPDSQHLKEMRVSLIMLREIQAAKHTEGAVRAIAPAGRSEA